jgi:acyl carrier protein
MMSAMTDRVPASATERDAFMTQLVEWIRTRFQPGGEAIDADTSLFEEGRIDSIRILELIAWTERALGRPIPDRWIRMDHFATVRRIAETFIGEDGRAFT